MGLRTLTANPGPPHIAVPRNPRSEVVRSHRRSTRLHDLSLVIPYLPTGGRVLEIGAGAGWQAKALAAVGFDVTAIDLPTSNYRTQREWSITDYDGYLIPFPSNSFDAVFSSNVLEHVAHIKDFQMEIRRVLGPRGVAIHVMPTATWRLWTLVTYYFLKLIAALRYAKARAVSGPAKGSTGSRRRTLFSKIRGSVVPWPHGVRGNCCTEGFYFSEWWWRRLFKESGWIVKDVIPSRLFFSGNRLFGFRLTFFYRSVLSRLLGSSSKIYVLRNAYDAEVES